jgi:asparagine synthase (glutamine-hydrolysing)
MCGIAGHYRTTSTIRESELAIGRSMAAAIAHRGPDDEGAWCDPELGVLFAHRRLSIIDLSAEGHQPMTSRSGRYVMAFNGEIYNHAEIRKKLAAETEVAWRGHSDTEVLLAAFDAWGVERTLVFANGMHAMAILDKARRLLLLTRDRFGEKPLYYGWQNGVFVFASELKALVSHPAFRRELDHESLPQYLRFGYVPAPRTIYKDMQKLGPGQYLRLPLGVGVVSPEIESYWTHPVMDPHEPADERTATDQLEAILKDAVRLRLQADVPVGAFLSGGIDSSTIVALAQAQSSTAVRTYSIGFHDRAYDESTHARVVAHSLGVQHTELFVTPSDALAVVPGLATIYDEPFADSSQIPTYLLAKLTRAHVTVALSGDGGDELFGGYNRYFHGRRLAWINAAIPAGIRAIAAGALSAIPARRWDQLLAFAPVRSATLLRGDRLSKLAAGLAAGNAHTFYKRLVSHWHEPSQLLPGVTERSTMIDVAQTPGTFGSPAAWMMYMDQLTYLPDDILVKVDRATMASALEVRVPFLDPAVAQFAAQLPLRYKMRGSTGKWLLRKVLYRYVDARLFERPKQGFAVPLAEWLRGSLREWAEELLSERALRDTVCYDSEQVRHAWLTHLSGRRNLHAALWVVLMYQMWHRQYRPVI